MHRPVIQPSTATRRPVGRRPGRSHQGARASAYPSSDSRASSWSASGALPIHRISRRTMLAISRAIEDEAAAAGGRPVLAAGFRAPAGEVAGHGRQPESDTMCDSR